MIIRYGCDITAERDGYYVQTWIEREGRAEVVDEFGPITELEHARETQRDLHATTKRIVDRHIATIKASLPPPISDANAPQPL